MSLIICTVVPDGVVISSDSRQSYTNQQGVARIGSDNATKIFALSDKIAVGITGLAFLTEEGQLKNLSVFIERFKNTNNFESTDVQDVADRLHKFLHAVYNWEIDLDMKVNNLRNDLISRGFKIISTLKDVGFQKINFQQPNGEMGFAQVNAEKISIIVAGYNTDNSASVYIVNVPGSVIEARKRNGFGMSWQGQEDVVSRIILGVDQRLSNVKFVNDFISVKGIDAFSQQIVNLQYNISWGTLTIQDAVDLGTLLIKTTSAIQRFSDGIVAEPGSIPGVGGHVDTAVITLRKGFVWLDKKAIVAGDKSLDFDQIKDIT